MTSQRYHNYFTVCAAIFWTSSIVEHIPILRSLTACRRVLAILDERRRKYGVKLLGYVLMPDHIHLVVWCEDGSRCELFIEQALRRISSALAGMTAEAADRGDPVAAQWLSIFRDRARDGARVRVWNERGRAFPATTEEAFLQKMRYVHENPVRQGLVERPEDWEFSSARWYLDGTGPIAMDDVPW